MVNETDKMIIEPTMVRGDNGERFFVLQIEDSAKDHFDPPICQICGGVLTNKPFYFCKDRRKWFCRDCNINTKCDIRFFESLEHSHFCIRGVRVIGAKNDENENLFKLR